MQTKPYDFNLDTKNKGFIPKMEFVQGDYKTNILNVTLTSDGTPIDLTGLTVIAAFSKPDGKKVIDSSIENDTLKIITPLEGLIQITLRTQAISAVGEVLTTVSLNGTDGKKLTSMEFKFKVRETFETDEIIQSTNELPILSKLIVETTTLENNVESAESIRADNEIDRQTNTTNAINLAVEKATYANTQGDYALEKATLADTKATLADQKATLAQTATTNANTAVTNINNNTLIIYKPYVATYADIVATYSIPELGWTTQTIDTHTRYRWNGTEWINIGVFQDDKIGDLSAINETNLVNAIQTDRLQLTTIRKSLDLAHYDDSLGEYVNLDKFWDSLRNGKIYTTEFNQYSVSPSSIGTKKDDNTGLVCEPSTNTVKGKNDYENIGLFKAIDVNAYVDENDDYHVIAIKGDSRFKNDGTNGDVYVMAMPGYIKRYFDANIWSISYSDAMQPGYEIIDEAVKPDGTIRPYLLHTKYIAGRNPIDGKLASISGVNAEYNNMSHNGQITEFKAKGVQYSGKTSHDDFYVQLMFWLKYANTNNKSVMKGCISYYLQYVNLIAEVGVKRVIITNAQANSLLVNSCVSIGDFASGTKTDDRQNTLNYNKANRVKIISIEDLGNGNSAVYVNSSSTFDTTITTTITTYPWIAGGCDNVLGTDGSPYSNLSGKEPFIINNIEMIIGGYEIIQNKIIYDDNTVPGDYHIRVYVNYDCKTYATTPNSSYYLLPLELPKTNATWQYVSKIVINNNHPSIIMPSETLATSTTGFGDAIYTDAPTTGYREWRSLGNLCYGSLCGLRYLNAGNDLTLAGWHVLGRLSATGRSLRRAGVN